MSVSAEIAPAEHSAQIAGDGKLAWQFGMEAVSNIALICYDWHT